MAGTTGSTSMVNVPTTPPATNTPQAPSTPPPVVPPPSSPPTNPPVLPQANDDSYNVVGNTLTVSAANGLLANDTNPGGGPMTAALLTPPLYGGVSVNPDGSFSFTNNNPGIAQTVTFTYQATANGLGSNTATVTLYVVIPPTITNPGNQAVAEGQAVSLPVSATGLGPLYYSAIDLPAGLAIDPTSGLISGNVDYAAAEEFGGTYATTVLVSGLGGGSTMSFGWTVTDTLQPPVLANPGAQANNTGEPVSLQLSTSSPEGNPLSYSAVGLPSGLAINPDQGTISGLIDHSASLTNAVTVTTTDTVTGLSASQSFAWAVTPTSHAATLDPIGDQTNVAGDVVDLTVNGNSVDGTPLTYTSTGLPSGLVMDPLTGRITGTIAKTAYSPTPYQVAVIASNGTLSASQGFTWKVGAIQFTQPADQSGTIGSVVDFQIIAQDLSGGAVGYTATGLPPGLTINPITGFISGTITAGPTWQGGYTVTITGTDGTYTGGPTFGWNVTPASNATAPTITDPGTQSNTAGDTVSLQINASSLNGAMVYSATGLPGKLAIDPATGKITGNFSGYDTGTTSVTVTVTDPLGGTASDTFTWVVAPAPVSLTVNALPAEAGKPTGPVAVATFSTTDSSAVAEDFSATISWGDGSTSQGAIAAGNGGFTGTAPFGHTYAAAGSFVLSVTVTRPDSSAVLGSNAATVSTGRTYWRTPSGTSRARWSATSRTRTWATWPRTCGRRLSGRTERRQRPSSAGRTGCSR